MFMGKWQGSPYPFKSPNYRRSKVPVFEGLCEFAGQPERVPVKGAANQAEFNDRVVNKLKRFTKIRFQYGFSLSDLEPALPLRYVFLLPSRHAVVVYAAYGVAISGTDKIADYEKVQEYLNINVNDDDYHEWGENSMILPVHLVRHQLYLYHATTPFRLLLDLKVRSYRPDHQVKNAKHVVKEIGTRDEWKRLTTPREILNATALVLQREGYAKALKFVKNVFRGAEKIMGELGKGKKKDVDAEKVLSLTKRYLTLEPGAPAPGFEVELPKKGPIKKPKPLEL